MIRLRAFVSACIFAAPMAAQAGTVEIPAQIAGAMSVPVTSLKEAKFERTLRQQFDFSCGSAALATLLTHQYGLPTDEQAIFESMIARGDQAKIRKEGFSLLDMKSYLASRGFEADGFEAPLESLGKAGPSGIPAIVLINEHGYNHFVVVKGLQADRVLIGDPASGTRAIGRERFDAMWHNKILFVVSNRFELARFNDAGDWSTAPSAPVGRRAGFDAGQMSNWLRLGSSDF